MTANGYPLVSIVSPVYNGEAHLRECIESVLAQTYPHWDYTLVDNSSTDRTVEIAKEYASSEPRIRIRTNGSFVPIIESHNAAVRQISKESKYCKVLGADDWLYPDCLEKMVRLAEAHPRVVIVGSYGCDGGKVVWDGLPYTRRVLSGRELCREYLLESSYYFGNPTTVLYRSDLVRSRHAFYNESHIHGDAEACVEFLENCDFGFVHQVLSYSRVREGSATAFANSFNTYLPFRLHILLRYGPRYFDEQELAQRIRRKVADYYAYLGSQCFRRRGEKFWDFHRDKLLELGYPLSARRLGFSAFSYGLGLAMDPKRTVQAIARRLPGRL